MGRRKTLKRFKNCPLKLLKCTMSSVCSKCNRCSSRKTCNSNKRMSLADKVAFARLNLKIGWIMSHNWLRWQFSYLKNCLEISKCETIIDAKENQDTFNFSLHVSLGTYFQTVSEVDWTNVITFSILFLSITSSEVELANETREKL